MIKKFLGKKIKVTYEVFEGEDYYDVSSKMLINNCVLLRRSSQTEGPFEVTSRWFFDDSKIGKKIEILN